ncbi:Aspartic peptidase domain [Pseudocohnilembus persalinus]|uniref:Aspartic peptidase domain n=1 Tax=Pseudocohnilembus persalinus TaxID=266149 RepID=A0A0V0QK85_PSEPJ|nr:Aspartic peptidase domain [Pseudocohnilembus persalinus]|eukprot:KRX02448.1 Aspartic peptidase domain [Pseudocohnilembus persalinus]
MFWVADSQCKQCKDMGMYNTYNCNLSETCFFDKSKFSQGLFIEYGHGMVSGNMANEFIYFNNQYSQDEEVQLQVPILLINQIQELNQFFSDGLIGLGREIEPDFSDSFLQVLKKSGLIEQKLFSLYLSGEKCSSSSVLTLGGYDPDMINGEINYLSTSKPGLWSIEIQQLKLISGSKTTDVNILSSNAIIDSGTTKITFPSSDLNQIIKHLGKQDIKCSTLQNFQGLEELFCESKIKDTDLGIILKTQNIEFKLNFQDLVNVCYFSFVDILGFVCKLDIQVVDINEDYLILLGDIFMKNYLTIFDEENDRIGFGKVSTDFELKQKELYPQNKDFQINLVYFQVGLICAISIIFVLLSNLYYKFFANLQLTQIMSDDTMTSQKQQGVTIDMSGVSGRSGIESLDGSQMEQEFTQENIGGRIKQTERENTDYKQGDQ